MYNLKRFIMNMLFNDNYIMLCINDNVHGKVIVKKRKYISNSVFLLKYYANNRSYKDYHIFDDYNRCELNNRYYKFIKDKLVIFMNQDRIRFITQTGIVIEYPMPMYVPVYLHILKDILFDPLHSFIKKLSDGYNYGEYLIFDDDRTESTMFYRKDNIL